MKTVVWLITLWCVFVCFVEHARSAEIILRNNGYENVLVAIADTIPEDPEIIEGIKDIFTEGSKKLFRATRYRASFRSVTILIPSTWISKPEYEARTSGQTFRKAALRIDEPNPSNGDRPYTRGFAPCGQQGLFIHLTPKYVRNKTFATTMTGSRGKTLVHEWGHFRWGLSDEYPVSPDSHYYRDEKRVIYPTACRGRIPGTHRNRRTKRFCRLNPITQLPERDCRFTPDINQTAAKASYMYMQFLTNVEDFCDDGTLNDPSIIHNTMAPNNQNTRCKQRSCWEVMRETEDFKNNNNPPNEMSDTTPSFRVVQSLLVKVVLLFDVSASMGPTANNVAPITMMQQAANNFIFNIIPDGSFIGIVYFSSGATEKAPIRKIKNREDRIQLSRLLPNTDHTEGGTAIGSGMAKAMSLLRSYSGERWAKGASVVLMTDGKNNEGVDPLTLIPVAQSYGIAFYTIAYSAAADQNLEKIARDTGGKSYFSTTDATTAALFNSLSDIAEESEGGSSNTTSSFAPLAVASTAENVGSTQVLQGKFAIDFTIGRDTAVTFNYLTKTASVEVRLEAPDGSVISKTNTTLYEVDSFNQIVRVDIPGIAQIGEWQYTVTTSNSISTVVLVNVQSKSRGEGQKPIRVQSWFGGKNSTLGADIASRLAIFAMVSRGYDPIIGLKVTATIEGSDNLKLPLQLQDKGYGPDLEAGDSVYSAEFGRFLLNKGGRYSVTINVENPENTAKIASTMFVPSSPLLEDIGEPTITFEDVGPVQRVASAGELKVESPSSPVLKDVIPPPMIRDLKVLSLDTDQGNVILGWTAVGDDVSKSNQTTYDLRIGRFEEIKQRFNSSVRIDLPGAPKEIGEEEEYHIDISGFNRSETYFLAIRVVDEAGNKGDPSNIITVARVAPLKFSNGDEIEIPTSRPTTVDSTTIEILDDGAAQRARIICGVLISLVVLIAVVIVVVMYLYQRKNSYLLQTKRQQDDQKGAELIVILYTPGGSGRYSTRIPPV